MSIVTYENVDTPVFEIDFPRYLFANGEQGSLWGHLPYYSDAAGTVEADWGDPVGNIPDASGNEQDWTQVTSTARPILRDSPPRLEFDGTDDLVTTTLPAISGGTIVLAGTNGIWIDEINFAGGAFSVGPGTYTGGPAGLLPILGDLLVEGGFVIDRALTPEEIAQVKRYYKVRGSAGLIELGPELVVNGDFSDGTSNWILSNNCSVVDGLGVFSGVVIHEGFYQNVGTVVGAHYLAEFDLVSLTSGFVSSRVGGADAPIRSAVGRDRSLITAVNNTSFGIKSRQSGTEASIDNVSLRRLIKPGETP